jgi:hypothetical protein
LQQSHDNTLNSNQDSISEENSEIPKLAPAVKAENYINKQIPDYLRIKKQALYLPLTILLLFIYIYSPGLKFIPGFGSLFSLFFMISVFLFWPGIFLSLVRKRIFVVFSMLILGAIIYCFAMNIFYDPAKNNIYFLNLYPIVLLRMYIEVFLFSIAFFIFFSKCVSTEVDDIIKLYFGIVVLQFLFVVLMLVFPNMRIYFFSNIFPIDTKIVEDQLIAFRGYGIASDYLFSYPLFNGLVAAGALWFAAARSLSYLTFVPLALIPVLLNARIGIIFIPIFLLSILIVIGRHFKRKLIKRISLILLLFPLIMIAVGLVLIKLFLEQTYTWAINGIVQIFSILILQAGKSWTLNQLLSHHINYPDSVIENILGTGIYLFDNPAYYLASDIGYINYLYYGGVVLSLLVYISFLIILFSAYIKSKSYSMKGLLVCGGIGFWLCHFKGIIVGSNSFLKGLVLLCVFIILQDVNSDNQMNLKK